MPSFNLGAVNAATDWVPAQGGTFSLDVSGTFAGTVGVFYRPTPEGNGTAVAKDLNGALLTFTGASGSVLGQAPQAEPDGQIQARMTAYTSGTATVRIGR
jgi:hypothetical protein